VLGDHDTLIEKSRSPVSAWMRAIRDGVGAMSAYELLALGFVMVVMVAVMVGSRAALAALWSRYRRRMNIAVRLLLLQGFVLVLLTLAGQRGFGVETLTDALFAATPWLAAVATVFATVYLGWTSLAERLLTPRHVCGVLLVSAAFAAAWVTLLRAAGVDLAAMRATHVAWMLSPVLLTLMTSVLAPWSLSRVRHT
jgi:hypothetical protein